MNEQGLKYRLLVAAWIAVGLPASAVHAAPTQARTSDSFVDMTGVVVKLGGGVPYDQYPAVRDKLLASGIRNIREASTKSAVVSRLQELASKGIKITWLLMPEQGTKPNASYWGTSDPQYTNMPVVDFLKNRLGVNNVRAVEMNNEVDRFYANLRWYASDTTALSTNPASSRYWPAYVQAATRDTWKALKADPATAHLPLIGPSFKDQGAYLAVGDLGAYLDYGCTHWYMAGRHPWTKGWGNWLNGYNYGSYGYVLTNMAQVTAPGKPMATTEGFGDTATLLNVKEDGSIDALHYPEVIHGRYLPRWYFRHYLGGTHLAFVYDFVDDADNPYRDEDNFGMLRHDLTEKPGYKAIKNLLNLLKEPGVNFTPGSLDYSLTGNIADVQSVLLQKSNGDFYLNAWVEKSSWDVAKNAMIAVPSQAVTLSVPASIGSATLYTLDDQGNMTSSSVAITNNQLSLNLTDRVSVIKLTPRPSGTGLTAQYYSGNNSNYLVGTRVDPTVDFNWRTGAPMTGVPSDNFSVVWSGYVQAVSSGTYTFTTTTDDGVRLFVGDLKTPLIDKWLNQSATAWSATVQLNAGQKYPIRVEYYEHGGDASARLEWLPPGQSAKQVVPQLQLYPAP
ncbi:hypothetical protein JQX13_32675 [Archangium violaceum]|uniref:PA14 domain-containing protein n=1 Tax=Archangium violaceum TaxID=83451 RepID=UPI00193BE012|nr:PA14 domain-containing protein [Archangium violaceum]QRK04948.1 hypothetical protein JQX13_32675 [Archangium violaceum]